MQPRYDCRYIDDSRWGAPRCEKKKPTHTHTLIDKYGAERERKRERISWRQHSGEKRWAGRDQRLTEGTGSEDWEKMRMMMQMVGGGAVPLPVESSCSPTSKDSLSVCDLEVFKQARYCALSGTRGTPVTHSAPPRSTWPRRPAPDCHSTGTSVMFKACWPGSAATLVALAFIFM